MHQQSQEGQQDGSPAASLPKELSTRTGGPLPLSPRGLLLPHLLKPTPGGKLEDALKNGAFIPKRQLDAQE